MQSELIEILRVGLKAVSPYNAQPWELKLEGGKLLIYVRHNDRGFWKNKESIYGILGAFLENLAQGAKHWHYDMSFALLENRDINMTKPLCEVGFVKNNDTCNYDISHVLARYTNRKTYHARPVPAEILKMIRDIYYGSTREVIDVTGHRNFIEGCAQAEKIRIMNQQLRDEISGNLSFTSQEATNRRRGLDFRTLELPFYAVWYMRLNQNRIFRDTIGKSFIPQLFVQATTRKLLTKAPLLLLFKETNPSAESTVRNWMDIQKILNELHRLGLSSQIVESSVDMSKLRPSIYTPCEREILQKAEAIVKKSVGFGMSSVLTLLRVGYADECVTKSLRKNPEELFWTDPD